MHHGARAAARFVKRTVKRYFFCRAFPPDVLKICVQPTQFRRMFVMDTADTRERHKD